MLKHVLLDDLTDFVLCDGRCWAVGVANECIIYVTDRILIHCTKAPAWVCTGVPEQNTRSLRRQFSLPFFYIEVNNYISLSLFFPHVFIEFLSQWKKICFRFWYFQIRWYWLGKNNYLKIKKFPISFRSQNILHQ